jgi:hypothetical protein
MTVITVHSFFAGEGSADVCDAGVGSRPFRTWHEAHTNFGSAAFFATAVFRSPSGVGSM